MFRTNTQLPPPQAIPAAPPKGSRRWLRWVVPLLAFLLGVGVGTNGDADPTTTPQYLSLQSQLDTSKDEAAQLTDAVEEAKAEIRQASSEAEEGLVQQSAELEQQAAQLEQRTAEVEARAKDVWAREKAVRAAEQEVTSPEPSAPVTTMTEPESQAPTSVYFENCTAARNAGAAPVRVGDPGYAGHLDRDGDGVGCE
jgi:colicin import membrane protein